MSFQIYTLYSTLVYALRGYVHVIRHMPLCSPPIIEIWKGQLNLENFNYLPILVIFNLELHN